MKNKTIIIITILLIIAIGNYFRIISEGSVRTVEFLSIFTIGVLAGVLLTHVINMVKVKK